MAKKEEVRVQENKESFQLLAFFKETKEELDKVVWPSREQL
ncbi:MAG: preprotein translocase subunit SecE, partial [Okeania sp. SIO1H6]|nr:preprotein translocase subunit SecE [Okeania sp. SIO1H6]